MTELSDAAVARLQETLERPQLPERYELSEVIGRGGMGVVWSGRDRALNREIAVKIVATHLNDPSFALRLQREARILAHLEHPGVVPVHDVGVLDDGTAWYVMRFVRGTRLDVAARSVATRGELLRIVERLCDTVAYAHGQNVVHRDLKPGNVMLGPFGEVLVLDWGVARQPAARNGSVVAARSAQRPPEGITGSGTVVGTPGYMAPEQADGGVADTRADVYGLGAILRELCVVHPDPIPKPLSAICDRAMARSPDGRYATPIEMRDDIRRFLDGGRVTAHHESALEAARRVATVYRTPILLVLAYLATRITILIWRGV